MTGSLKYKSGTLNFSSQLEFPGEDEFEALGLLNINFKMTEFLKYEPGILNFSS